MTINKFFVHEVTIVHPGEMDSGYGTQTEADWDNATETYTHGWLQRLAETENTSATRDENTTNYMLRLPLGTTITSHDRVRSNGLTFEVDGEPWTAPTPRGGHHRRVGLVLIDG